MTPERWKEIESVFHSALECAPGERAAFIDRECAGNEPLRAEVHALLSAESLSRDFLQNSAIETVAEGIANRGTLAAGHLFGHYRIESRLGAGGMGEVYLAIDQRTDRKVALKLLPDYLTNDEQRVRRFQQEARTVLALNHPNIVTTYEVGELGGLSYIASEFIEGQTLREVFSQREVDVREGVDLVMQIAGALNAAHDAGIVHRDIKPENIMLRPDGYVKILDFGIAKLNVEDSGLGGPPDATSPGILVGTARYMSPEQARGLAVDPRSDLWSLGVVCYEMLSGRVPFAGATPSDCIAAILEKSPAPLRQVAPDVQPKLQWIVDRLLRKDRDERYHTAREVLGDLRELKQEFETQSRLEDGSARDLRRRISPVRVDGRAGQLWLPKLVRNKWAIAGALLIVVLLVVAGLRYLPAKKQTIDSLAVLPFVNVGSDPNSEYLADSLTESLINHLSQLPNMSVIARNSVFRYKVADPKAGVPNPQQVAKELDVKAVLIGRIIQRGDDLFVSAELVSAADNSHLWGAQYNRKVADVFAVQDQLARDISSELRSKLAGENQPLPPNHDTASLRALEFYMKGRSYVHRRTREDLLMAGSYYQKAIEADQNYAQAYAGLAEVYANLGVRGYMPPIEGRLKLQEAARKALALDDNLPEAHVMMGNYYIGFAPYQFAEGDREIRRAIEISPSLAIAHLYLALSFLRQNRLDEGLNEMLKARELDPFSAIIARQVSLYYLLKRDYSRALQLLKQASEMGPPFTASNEIGIYTQNKLYDEALAVLDQEELERKADPILIYSRGMVYAAQGRRADALKIASELERLSSNSSQALWIAKIYAALNEKDQAFNWLERGLATGALGTFFVSEPTWDSLRNDPRFVDVTRKTGIPQA